MSTIILSLLFIILLQAAYIAVLQRSPMGILTPTALRIRLSLYSLLRVRCFVVGFDIRKMKSLNAVLGYSNSCETVGRLIASTRRYTDIVGQYGGDEFIICGRGDAKVLVSRLLEKRDEINSGLTSETKMLLSAHTDGLIDGLHLAIASIPQTRDAFSAARICIDATEPLKACGRETGNRDTSGRQGTLIVSI
jgi:GGDEF domain-containing protein